MNAKQFFDLVSMMRKYQIEYFKTRRKDILEKAKALEIEVDNEIRRVQSIVNEPTLPFV